MTPVAALLCAILSTSADGQASRDSATAVPLQDAAPDTTARLLLPPVEVSAQRIPRAGDPLWIPNSARLLYPDDGSKPLMADLRVTSPLPLSADLRLYGLPVDQTARDYVWGHRIGGPTTVVFGTRTKINPDIAQVALHPFLMSHRYRDTNGALDLQPTFHSDHPPALSISSDAIERRATYWMARGSDASSPSATVVASVRQSDVVGPLERSVRALSIIPDYLDSQALATFRVGDHTIEGFFLHGRESGDWQDTADGLDGSVHEDTRQDLAILRYQLRLPRDSKLSAGASWEGDRLDSRHVFGAFDEQARGRSHILNPRLEFTTARDAWTFWASEFYVESDRGEPSRNSSPDAGAEGRVWVGPLRIQPSLSVQHFRDESTILHGVTVTAYSGRTKLSAGYGTYADYFVFKDGIFETVFDSGAAQQPQRALHYAATIQYEPERKWPFDIARISAVRKDLDVDLWGIRDAVRVLSWDCMVARSGTPSWELACLSNDARGSDGPLVGLIPLSFRSGISCNLVRTFSVSLEGNYRSGAIAEVRAPGPRQGEHYRLASSRYVNLALNQKVLLGNRPINVTVTIFNALALAGDRAEITQDEYGRRYDAPCWANLRVRYDLW